MPSIINATTTNGVAVSGDNSGALALQTNNGTTAITIDSSQNVGIGTVSPTNKFTTVSTDNVNIVRFAGATYGLTFASFTTGGGFRIEATDPTGLSSYQPLITSGSIQTFLTNNTERMRIDSTGRVLVNSTSDVGGNNPAFSVNAANAGVFGNIMEARWTGTSSIYHLLCRNGNGLVGGVTTSGSTTAFVTSSDYRLKENIAPMTGALEKVAQLKPVTYTWKSDGSDGQGFIAHELQAVVPDAVTGEKDAVDAEGNPVYQGVDTSFLVATLTAAIQELKAELDATKAEVQALKGAA